MVYGQPKCKPQICFPSSPYRIIFIPLLFVNKQIHPRRMQGFHSHLCDNMLVRSETETRDFCWCEDKIKKKRKKKQQYNKVIESQVVYWIWGLICAN